MANQELELAFNANTTTRKYESWTEISCNKGLFSVSAPTLEEARNEAMHYFFQYYSDGEYCNDETHVFVVVKDGVKVISDHAEYMALSSFAEMPDPISIESVIKKRFSKIRNTNLDRGLSDGPELINPSITKIYCDAQGRLYVKPAVILNTKMEEQQKILDVFADGVFLDRIKLNFNFGDINFLHGKMYHLDRDENVLSVYEYD